MYQPQCFFVKWQCFVIKSQVFIGEFPEGKIRSIPMLHGQIPNGFAHFPFSLLKYHHLGMDQYLLIPFLVGWTSIYQLFWCSPRFKVLTHCHTTTLTYPLHRQKPGRGRNWSLRSRIMSINLCWRCREDTNRKKNFNKGPNCFFLVLWH